MREYESVLLSKAVIELLLTFRNIVHHTDKPTISDIVQEMASSYQILNDSDVALIFNGWGYEMIDSKEIEREKEEQ
jgi:hypothetical protein